MAMSRPLLGVLSAAGASVVFSVNDVSIKFLSGDYALHQVVLIRSSIALLFVLLVLVPFGGGYGLLRTKRLPMHIARASCVVVSNMLYFLALAVMPIAEAVAVFFVAPLLITAFSVILLSEKVGPRRWAAVAVGLLGVIVMLRPGTGAFQPAALLVLASAAAYAAMHMFTRRIGGTESAVTLAFYIQVTFVAFSAGVGLVLGDGRLATEDGTIMAFMLRAWVWPDPADWPILLATGIASGLGGYLIGQAYKLVEAGLAAPFEYVALPMAIFWGALIFGEWPDMVAWIGIALILGGGLYTMWREAVLARRERELVRNAA